MRADGSQQHLVGTGIQGVVDVAWGSAPLVPAGSPGTLSRPAAGAHVPGTSRRAAVCHEAPAWLASMRCSASAAGMTPGDPGHDSGDVADGLVDAAASARLLPAS